MDKPRPGQESEPPVRRPPMEIVGEQNRRTIGDQRLLLAKTRMCKTSTLSEIWLVPIFCFFSFSTRPLPVSFLSLFLIMTN